MERRTVKLLCWLERSSHQEALVVKKVLLSLAVFCLTSLSQVSADPNPQALRQVTSQILCTCGCSNMLVSSCECSKAAEMTKEAAALLDEGKSEKEVLATFEKEYGPTVLAAPQAQGFNLIGWIMPFIALGMGSLVVAVVYRRLKSPPPPVEADSALAESAVTDEHLRQQLDEELRL